MIFGKATKAPETLGEFEQLCPDLYAQALEAGKALVDAEAIARQATDQAFALVTSLIAAAFGEAPGAKFAKLLAAGVTPEQVKALGISLVPSAETKEGELMKQMLETIKGAGADNPGAGAEDTNQPGDPSAPIEDQAKTKWDKDPALRQEFTKFESYLAFLRASTEGRAKVLSIKQEGR